ncbi:MAG: MBL fold metallo-hydrolase [Saprospiraceae bacterium]|nr:MBL fold metallo-hydrolase [Saprospiraceae bacterium]
MAEVISFTFNPFQENTYLVADDSGECVIFDPGCYEDAEKEQLRSKIEEHGLKPVRLINTHCHIDHIFGNRFVYETYGLPLEIHRDEKPVLKAAPEAGALFGIMMQEISPEPGGFLEEGDLIEFGSTSLRTLLTPGHSPASLSFYCEEEDFVIAGDVLFQGSIGRTDLPGGDFDTLIQSIREKLLPLGDSVRVYPGHGPATYIGYERQHNPFL